MNEPQGHHPSNVRAGFSLIEILIVLVLITLITSLAVPSMGGYVDRTRTRRALDQIVSDVAYARLLAVEQGRRAAVSIDPEGTYTIATLDDGGSWVVLKTVDLQAEFTGLTVGQGLTNLEFSSRGMLSSDTGGDGFIRVSRASARDSAFVSPAGRIYRAF